MYVDGDLKTTTAASGTFTSSTKNITIGKEAVSSSYYYKGYIDEVMVFSRTLTDTEITDYYNNLVLDSTKNLEMWFKFDENTGTTIYDTKVAQSSCIWNDATTVSTAKVTATYTGNITFYLKTDTNVFEKVIENSNYGFKNTGNKIYYRVENYGGNAEITKLNVEVNV